MEEDRIFCGNGRAVPPGYTALGTRYECLRRGFGTGLHARRTSFVTTLGWLGLGIVAVVVAVWIYNRHLRSRKRDDRRINGQVQRTSI